MTVRSSALRTDIIFDSESDDDDDDRRFEALSEDERSDDSFVDSDLEILAEVAVPHAKARLPRKPPGGGSLSRLSRKKEVSRAAKEPLRLISGGKALEGCVAARRSHHGGSGQTAQRDSCLPGWRCPHRRGSHAAAIALAAATAAAIA
jgi:hypothetical protein